MSCDDTRTAVDDTGGITVNDEVDGKTLVDDNVMDCVSVIQI